MYETKYNLSDDVIIEIIHGIKEIIIKLIDHSFPKGHTESRQKNHQHLKCPTAQVEKTQKY